MNPAPGVASAPLGARLTAFLQARLPGARDIRVENLAALASAGNAREAWAFDVRWRDGEGAQAVSCVMLVKASAGQLETALTPEFNVIKALWGSGVPVPRALWLDAEGEGLGQPFFIMERVPGTADVRTLRHPDRAQAARPVAEHFVEVTARLHAWDWRSRGIDFLAVPTPENAAARQIASWESLFLRNRMEPHPILVDAFLWLKEHQPVAERISLVHGDYRPGNFLYDGGRLTALLDWEMVHLGDPVEDIAWAYRSFWSLEPVLPLDEFISRYTALSGIPIRPAHLLFYRLLSEVKHAVIALTGARSFRDGRTRNLAMADRAAIELAHYLARFMAWLPDEGRSPRS